MKKTKFSHKVMAVFLTLTFLPSLFPVNYLFASNNGPTAPEAASFEPVDAPDMVNLSSGDLSYVLPLLNVPSPEGGYPLALSYHAGVALDQEASWVGLGWNINPGAINRGVVGVPDDWKKGLKSKVSFDSGGTIVIENLNLGVGVTDEISVGLNATWVTNKTLGGERSTDFNINGNVSYSDNDGSGISAGLAAGTDGFSIFGGANGNIVGITKKGSSVGISFQTNIGGMSSKGNISNSDRTKPSGRMSSRPVGDTWQITANIGIFSAGYNRRKFKYWFYDEKDYLATGSLYSGSFDEVSAEDPLYFFNEYDTTESLFSPVDYSKGLSDNNPSYIAYDNYRVDAQGMNASIAPLLLEKGRMHSSYDQLSDNSLYKNINGSERSIESISSYFFLKPESGDRLKSSGFNKSLENSLERPHFYVSNEYSSFHRTTGNNRTDFVDSQGNVNFNELLMDLEYSPTISSGEFNNSSKRMRKSSYVEAYTNKEIQEDSDIIYDASRIDRATMPQDGIGAFKVTAIDGKTYHYSIPVYQKESGKVIAKSDENIQQKYMEENTLEPYATHWLVTAITGPDFVDNGNNAVGEGDLGYWVRFDYGKWSDGYSWRMPQEGLNYTDNAKSYSWGAKDLYYLNSVVTRTHTALFIKEERTNNELSADIQRSDANGNPVYRQNTITSGNPDSFYQGTDGGFYWVGAYDRLFPIFNPYIYTRQDAVISSENWFHLKSKQIPSLALKEVMLLKNQNVPENFKDLSYGSGNNVPGNPVSFEIKFEESNYYQYRASDLRYLTYQGPRESYSEKIYRGEYYGNILEDSDYNFTELRKQALKTVYFNYSNSLGKHSGSSGKLTLEAIQFNGRQGIGVMPPYTFDYYEENEVHPRENYDDWGYHKTRPWAWSLKDIVHPLGGKISVQYESDSFFEKTVESSYLDNNLQVKFEGTNSGSKFVSIRQDPNIASEQELDLRDFFQVNDYYDLDIQYFKDPSHNGDNWIADVATSCRATNVSSTVVKFQIPTNSTKTWTRLNGNCTAQDWVYYQSGEYNHVVDETVDWDGEKNQSRCDALGDDSEKIKIRVFFDDSNKQKTGGGLRTGKITLIDDQNNRFETVYNYNLLNTGTNSPTNVTSGTTSYAPVRKYQKNIPYLDLQLSPGVLYKNIRVVHNNETYTDYRFNVLEDYTLSGFNFENNLLRITANQGIALTAPQSGQPRSFQIDEKFYDIENKISSLGALISKKIYNKNGQILNMVSNAYFETAELQSRFTTESFVKEESLSASNTNDIPVNLSSTTMSYPPAVIKEVTEIANGHSYKTTNEEFDPVTGEVLVSSMENSEGQLIRTQKIPAYSINEYSEMGSKVDNPSNRNMLTQEAMGKTLLKVGNTWETISAGITTWSPDLSLSSDDGWRKHKSFIWDGTTDNNGIFTNFTGLDDNFNWTLEENQQDVPQPNQWKQVSEVSIYDKYSMPLETIDINGNKAATRMSDKDSKVLSSGNAGYYSLVYNGAEYTDNSNAIVGRTNERAHTGEYSVKITNEKGFYKGFWWNTPGTYRISVWASKDNYENARVFDGSNLVEFNREKVIAGNWVMLNHEVQLGDEPKEIYVTSNAGEVFFDDFRIHPIESSMSSYVYNKWDELTHILGPNNMATRYEYDEAGRLINTWAEIEDVDQGDTGGFKKTSNHKYNYKTAQ